MDFFSNNILNIDDIFELMNKPRDLSLEEFIILATLCSVKPWKNCIESMKTFEVVIDSGIASTNSEVRRLIKQKSLAIGRKTITNFDDELTEKDFFETGNPHFKWTTVRNGKKIHRIILLST